MDITIENILAYIYPLALLLELYLFFLIYSEVKNINLKLSGLTRISEDKKSSKGKKIDKN